jgi:hypothetical protein
VQRYIKDPLLLDGRKSEMRLYWLLASTDPLMVLLYTQGTVRLNTLPFQLGEFDNPLIHVTNVFQQKSHPDYDPEAVLKWSFSELNWYLREHLKKTDCDDYVQQIMMPQFRQMLAFVTKAVSKQVVYQQEGLCFGLYGADIIIDANLNPWLTEIQIGPGLSFDDPIKREVLPPMLKEAVAIMLEVRKNKIAGKPLSELSSVKDFQWVIKPF